jgi:hypothetical protein
VALPDIPTTSYTRTECPAPPPHATIRPPPEHLLSDISLQGEGPCPSTDVSVLTVWHTAKESPPPPPPPTPPPTPLLASFWDDDDVDLHSLMVPSDPPPVANMHTGPCASPPDDNEDDNDDNVQQDIPVTPPLCAPFTTVVGPRVFSSSTRTWQQRGKSVVFVLRRVSVSAGSLEDLWESGRSGRSMRMD